MLLMKIMRALMKNIRQHFNEMSDNNFSFEDFLTYFISQNLSQKPIDEASDLYKMLQRSYEFARHYVLKQLICSDPYFYKMALYDYTVHLFLIACVDGNLDFIPRDTLDSMDINQRSANGIVQNASDNTTAASILVPDFYKNLSLSDLSCLRTPYGRNYLMMLQQMGSLWGLTR